MLGATWIRRQAQQRFVICRAGLCVCVCNSEEFGLWAEWGKPRRFMMSDKHWEWSMPSNNTDWKALGGCRKWEGGDSRVWECLGLELSFSFPFPLSFTPLPPSSNLAGKPSHFTNLFESEVLKWQQAVRSPLVILPLLSTSSLVPFQASVSLSRQYYTQSHRHRWDFKALCNEQDNTIKHTRLDDGGGFGEDTQGQQLSDDSAKHVVFLIYNTAWRDGFTLIIITYIYIKIFFVRSDSDVSNCNL